MDVVTFEFSDPNQVLEGLMAVGIFKEVQHQDQRSRVSGSLAPLPMQKPTVAFQAAEPVGSRRAPTLGDVRRSDDQKVKLEHGKRCKACNFTLSKYTYSYKISQDILKCLFHY